MRILWIATKTPWPPVDGGRLLLWNTLEALAGSGCRVDLVAPAAGARLAAAAEALKHLCRPHLVRRSPALPGPLLWLLARARGEPLTIVRHRRPAVARRVAALLASDAFDAIQVEQLQALAQAPASGRVPVTLRAQNVESDLWRATADAAALPQGRLRRPLLRAEARRLARWEGRAVRRTAATVALTAEDARRLAALAGRPDRVRVVPAPFPDRLPDAGRSLPGEPPVVVLGSAGWPPNRDGLRWLAAAWPRVRTVLPAARLHVFGSDLGAAVPAGDASIVVHPPPADSRQAFAPGSVLVVPLRVASGVRMKILEAWARGVPVVATPEAARGLDAEDGRQLLLAATAEQLARALERLRREPALAGALVREGREILRRRHALPLVAGALMRLWTETLRTER